MFHILRGGKITDGLRVPLERLHAVLVYSVSQELHGGGGEHTLCRVDLQAVLLKDGEDLPEMLDVLLQAVAGDDDVIQVAEDEGEVLEDAVHEVLEGLGGVAEAKGHEEVLEQTERVMIAILAMSWAAIGI